MIDYTRARRTMVDNQLRTSGITDWRILDAMNRVPREKFVSERSAAFAYADDAIALSPSRMVLRPADFARLIQLAEITSQDLVLDLGCGTGYSTAVLAYLSSAVFGLESDEALAEKGNNVLEELGVSKAAIATGPIEAGLKKEAPFDVIVLEGAVDAVPQPLFGQLRDGGRLVAVIGTGNSAVAHLFLKSGDDVASISSFNASVPVLGQFASPPAFVF